MSKQSKVKNESGAGRPQPHLPNLRDLCRDKEEITQANCSRASGSWGFLVQLTVKQPTSSLTDAILPRPFYRYSAGKLLPRPGQRQHLNFHQPPRNTELRASLHAHAASERSRPAHRQRSGLHPETQLPAPPSLLFHRHRSLPPEALHSSSWKEIWKQTKNGDSQATRERDSLELMRQPHPAHPGLRLPGAAWKEKDVNARLRSSACWCWPASSRGRQVSGTPSEEACDKPAGQRRGCKPHSAG